MRWTILVDHTASTTISTNCSGTLLVRDDVQFSGSTQRILNSELSCAWDVAETVDSLLLYLGKNAITDTRYFWEPDLNHVGEHASILFTPRMLRPLIDAAVYRVTQIPKQAHRETVQHNLPIACRVLDARPRAYAERSTGAYFKLRHYGPVRSVDSRPARPRRINALFATLFNNIRRRNIVVSGA